MATVRVLVGTRKGAFVLTSDEARRDWRVEGPHFAGWQVMHVNGSPAAPDRLWASQWTEWHGQVVQRSDDGGRTWEAVGNAFALRRRDRHAPVVRRHAAPVGVREGLAPRAVAGRPGHGLRRGGGRGDLPLDRRGRDLGRAARAADPSERRRLGAGGRRPLPAHDPDRPGRPAADVRRHLGGRRLPHRGRRARPGTWRPAGCAPSSCPTRRPRSATACTTWPCTPRGPRRSSCRSTGTSAAATTPAGPGAR